jgi:hypothetical protein
MKAYLAMWAILLIAVSARSEDVDRKPQDEAFLRNTWLESMTSSGASLIRVQLTMDMERSETKEEFYK